jgi:glutamate/aspartate transport system substrate-binding protein
MLPWEICMSKASTRISVLTSATTLALALAATTGLVQAQTTLKKVQDTGEIVMGVRESSSPLSFTLGNNQFTGYHIDMCLAIIDKIKATVGKPVTVKYTPVTSQNRIPLTQNGTVDLECGSTTNNATRQKDVSFGMTTYVTEVRMAVKAKSGITNISQLNGKTIATTTGTTSVQTLRKHKAAEKVNFKEVFGKDHADSFLLMESGRADAFVMDDNILAGLIANAKDPKEFKIVGEVLSIEPIAVMFRKDDPGMKTVVDFTIREMMQNGALDKLYKKWFQSPIPPKNTSVNLPMGATLKGLFKTPNDSPMEAYAK